MNHLMIDIWALGAQPNAAICFIESVFFEPSTGRTGASLFQMIDPRTAQDRGAYISIGSMIKWLDQDERRIGDATLSGAHETHALINLARFIENAYPEATKENLKVWCKNGSRVFPILHSAYERASLEGVSLLPWRTQNECCFRSLLTVAGVIGYAPHPRPSVTHNAVTDAIYQAEQVCEIWQRLTSPHLETL
jgi:hypothetical protein